MTGLKLYFIFFGELLLTFNITNIMFYFLYLGLFQFFADEASIGLFETVNFGQLCGIIYIKF